MKKLAVVAVFALLLGAAIIYAFLQERQERSVNSLLAKLLNVEKELSDTKKDLLGYTKYTDYLSVSKTAMAEQMKFLAAKVDREYVHVQHLEKSTLGLKTQATIIVNYAVEDSFGYDLKPDSFSITGDKSGITVTLNKPELVASPAVHILSHEIPSKGFFHDEKSAVIALQQQLSPIAKKRANDLKKDLAVIALCEKKMGEFLHDFLAKQPNVRSVPTIKFAYSKSTT